MNGNYGLNRLLPMGDFKKYVTDKKRLAQNFATYMVSRLSKMFKYENLPDTIPAEILEYYLLVGGTCIIAEWNGPKEAKSTYGTYNPETGLYVFYGTFGGNPDAYNRPTQFVVANAGLRFDKTFTLGTDCVLMRNDTMWAGLLPIIGRYSALLTENTLTMRLADIMLRTPALITAPNGNVKKAADEFISQLERGELKSIGESRLFDGVRLLSGPSGNGRYLTQFIEFDIYTWGKFWNEVGLNAPTNAKRESLNDDEVALGNDTLMPLCDNMLQCRKEDVAKVNEMFGTNISVDYDSAWKVNMEESELALSQLKSEGDSVQVSQLSGENSDTSPMGPTSDETLSQLSSDEENSATSPTGPTSDISLCVEVNVNGGGDENAEADDAGSGKSTDDDAERSGS